jgi:peptidoglycan/xylan/chitin deacetylase (PgdA/CDA1 family)
VEAPRAPEGLLRNFSVLYHDVLSERNPAPSGFPSPDAGAYKLSDVQFSEHLDRIATVVSVPPAIASDLLHGTPAQRSDRAWMLHFDDGGSSALHVISPLLLARGWRGHFHMPTDYIGREGFLSRDELRALRAQGHVVGSHSCSHPLRISSLGDAELLDEWRRSRDVLSETLGEDVVVASVPGGFYSERVARAAARAGIRILFNSEPTAAIGQVDGCLILGRYSIMRQTAAETAAAIVSGRPSPRYRQYLYWNGKKVAKMLAGPLYARIRKSLLK